MISIFEKCNFDAEVIATKYDSFATCPDKAWIINELKRLCKPNLCSASSYKFFLETLSSKLGDKDFEKLEKASIFTQLMH